MFLVLYVYLCLHVCFLIKKNSNFNAHKICMYVCMYVCMGVIIIYLKEVGFLGHSLIFL